MRKSNLTAFLLVGSSLAILAACSSKSSGDGTAGTGGTVAAGGVVGVGGTGATGGTVAAGGAASGGTAGSGTGGDGTGGAVAECTLTFDRTDPTAGLGIGENTYTYQDTLGSCMGGTNPEPGKVCLTGTVPAHNGDYNLWGAGFGTDFYDPLTTPIDISAHQGFKFTLEGTLPPELRATIALFNGDSANDQGFFTTDVALGENIIAFTDLAQGSWVAGTADEMAWDATKGAKLQFQVASNKDTAVTIDFCISAVEWVDEIVGGSGGAAGTGGDAGAGGAATGGDAGVGGAATGGDAGVGGAATGGSGTGGA